MVCGCINDENVPHGLHVKLFRVKYFEDGERPCTKELYEEVLGGEGSDGHEFPWTYDVSYEMMLKHCAIEADLKDAFPQLTRLQIFLNWLRLCVGLACFLVPGMYYLVVLAQAGEKHEAAAMLMAKRAYDLERVAFQTTGPGKDREEDVIVHHLVCAYYHRYIEISNEHNPFTTFFQFRELYHVDTFISDNIQRYLTKYGWVNKLQFRNKVITKAKAALSRQRAGRTTSMIALAAILFTVYLLLLIGMAFTGHKGLIVFAALLLIVDIVLTILYLGTWVPVTRRVAGLVQPSFSRWQQGKVSGDEIGKVTDLALLAIRCSEAEVRDEGKVSEHCWINLLHHSERTHPVADRTSQSGRTAPSSEIDSSRPIPAKTEPIAQQQKPQGHPPDPAQYTSRDPREDLAESRYSRDLYQPRAGSPSSYGVPPPLPRFHAGTHATSHPYHYPESPTAVVVDSSGRTHVHHFSSPSHSRSHSHAHSPSRSHSGPRRGPDSPLAAPPVARNAEAMGYSQAQMAEIFQQGYEYGRQQQSRAYGDRHHPLVV